MDERIPSQAQEHLAPPLAPAASEVDAGSGLDDPRALQILSTEHWSLLSQRSLVYNEAFARASMFMTFVSATLVALGFVGNAMAFSREFLVLGGLLLFVDLAIGLATLGRMLDASVDDLRSIAGMNRIRNAYVRIAPGVEPYLTAGIHDDTAGVVETYGAPKIRAGLPAFIHGLTTAGGMVMMIDALLGGVLGGTVGLLLGASAMGSFALGAVVLVALLAVLNRYAFRVFAGFEGSFPSRFPTPRA